MKPLRDVPADQLARLTGVLADIDDTISTEGKITAEAFGALWRLHQAGLKVIPVTGRPAGWCDHLARFWPVDAVVGENGGFYFHHDGRRLQRRFLYDDDQRRRFRQQLEAIQQRIFDQVPGVGIASDQPYREYDLAVDFCEDVPTLDRDHVLRIKTIFEQAGAHAKISSIHVNGWFGDFDKLSTARLCIRELFEIDLDANRDAFAYCGDSPNDEPMFAWFPLSFGMANILDFRDLLEHPPAYITTHRAGAGFCEVADAILAARSTRA